MAVNTSYLNKPVLKIKLKRGKNSIRVIINLTNQLVSYWTTISWGLSECNWAQGNENEAWQSFMKRMKSVIHTASDHILIDYWLLIGSQKTSLTVGRERDRRHRVHTGLSDVLEVHRNIPDKTDQLKHENLQCKHLCVLCSDVFRHTDGGLTSDMKVLIALLLKWMCQLVWKF